MFALEIFQDFVASYKWQSVTSDDCFFELKQDQDIWIEHIGDSLSSFEYTEIKAEIDAFGFPVVTLRRLVESFDTLFVKLTQGSYFSGKNLTSIGKEQQKGIWMIKDTGEKTL